MALTKTEIKRMNTSYSLVAGTALAALSSSTDADIYTATTDTYGICVDLPKKQAKYVFIISNGGSSSATIHIRKGTHSELAVEDLELSIAASGSVALQLDTARFMKLTGARQGQVCITGAVATVKVQVIELV